MVAGHDTTASLIGNSVVALFRNPAQLGILRGDPGKIPAALEEFLRFDAPVPHSTFRYAAEPVTIAGQEIPAGAQVIICMAAANRDPDRYATPSHSTSTASPVAIWPSGTACITVSVPPWPAWRAKLPSRPCSDASRSSRWPSARRTCTGVTVTVWYFGGFPSCPSSPGRDCPGRTAAIRP